MLDFVKRYSKQIRGTLTCLDRVVLTGTLTGVCHANGMASFLYSQGILLKDYPNFVQPFRDELRSHIENIAHDQGLEIEYISTDLDVSR